MHVQYDKYRFKDIIYGLNYFGTLTFYSEELKEDKNKL